MKLLTSIFATLFVLWSISHSSAQIMTTGVPYKTIQKRGVAMNASARVCDMPSFDVEKERQISDSAYIKERRYKFGKTFDVNISPKNAGEWQVLDDGTRIWEVEIVSEGALSINLIFKNYKLPEGARLFIFNIDRSHVIGAFTSLNNKASAILPTLPVFGDHIVVQYVEPLDVEFEGEFCIDKVTHDYKGVYNKLRVGSYGDAASCQIDVSCKEQYEDTKRSVVKMIISGSEICSGVLVNNTKQDETPYVLSARHCFMLDTTGSSTLIIFNYETPDCRIGIEGVREQSVAGAEMIALSPGGSRKDIDFALIKASVDIPETYQPYFAGWNSNSIYPQSSYTIHHPLGDVKKVTWDTGSAGRATLTIDYMYLADGHFRIRDWEGGVTEGGSSGAALFNQDNQVVGALSGGASTCDDPTNDYFFRLSKAWDTYSEPFRSLKSWLDPTGNNVRQIDGMYSADADKLVRVSHIKSSEAIGVVSYEAGKGYLSGLNSYGTSAVVESFSQVTGDLQGMYFIPFSGSYSESSVVKVQVWSGNGKPEKVIHEQELLVSEWTRAQNVSSANYGQTGGFSVVNDYKGGDFNMLCYVPFSSSIYVDGDCFVGFAWEELADTFVVMQSTERVTGDDNTAWYQKDNQWKPFSEYPSGVPAALSLELLYKQGESNSVVSYKLATEVFKVTPSASGLELRSDDVIDVDFLVSVYDLSGKLVTKQVYSQGLKTYNLNTLVSPNRLLGLYIMQIESVSFSQTVKVLLPVNEFFVR